MKLLNSEQLFKLANKLDKQAQEYCFLGDDEHGPVEYAEVAEHLWNASNNLEEAATLLEEQETREFCAEEVAIMQQEDLETLREANPGVLEAIERGEVPAGFLQPGDEGF